MDWIRGRNLGRGSTATVYMAEDLRSGEVFAVKSAELNRSEFLKREQGILSTISCPQIVAYKGCDVTFENGAHRFNLFMEYAPHGTLTDVIKKHGGGMEEALVGSYARQILIGLNYLHLNGIVHCDVKGQNVLVTEQGAKISDMGCARRVKEEELTIAGTPAFMAPEVARGEQQGFPADVWALGCTVLEMITGKPLWRGVSDPAAVLYRVGFSGESPEIPSSASEQGKDFLSKCFKRDPNERWSVNELLGHGFVIGEFKELELDSDTPTSVLERGCWDSLETTQSEGPTRHCCSSSDSRSARDRLRSLCGIEMPVWDDDQWVMVRSNEKKLDALSFEEIQIQDSDSDTICVVSDLEDGLVIFHEPKFVLVDNNTVVELSRCKLCNANAILDYCRLRSYIGGCRIRKLLLVCQCRKIVPRVKLDTNNNKEIFIMPCFLHSLCLFTSPLDESKVLRFQIELNWDTVCLA